MEAVERLQYRPNHIARSLRRNESHFVIVVMPDINNSFFAQIIRGMEDVAHAQDYQVLLCNTDNDPERELSYIKVLQGRAADGMAFLTARVDSAYIEQLSQHVPVVLGCEYAEGLSTPSVSIDNVHAAFTATRHLIQLGHRRIALINGPKGVILSQDRLQGYSQAMQQTTSGLECRMIRDGTFYYESGFRLIQELLTLSPRPTAVFCANDEMAIGAINGARALGLRVPEDLAVVGFDNIPFASMYNPALTTIAQPMYEIGETTMHLLLALIRKEPISIRKVVLPHRLMVRQSCGAKC